MDSAKLIETIGAAQKGNRHACAALYNEYAKSVYFIALKLLKNPQYAEDMTSEVFLNAFRRLSDLRHPEAFPQWLNRIVTNKCTEFLTRDNQLLTADIEEVAETGFTEETDRKLIPDKRLEDEETARLITEIIDKLPLPQRVCVYYYYYELLTIKEIAALLTVTESTVKNRLALARAKIETELRKLDKDEGLKLWAAFPFMLIPLLRVAMRNTEVPVAILGRITEGLNITASAIGSATVTTPASGTAAVTETAAAGSAVTAEKATAGTVASAVAKSGAGKGIAAALCGLAACGAVAGATMYYWDDIKDNIPFPNTSQEAVVRENTPATAASTELGDIIRFGGHNWVVLEIKDNSALIITEKVIESRAYHNRREFITWETSDLRKYLNGEFYESFDESDREKILPVINKNPANPWMNTHGGEATEDYIFLLSLQEVVRHYGDSGQLESGSPNSGLISSAILDDEYNSNRAAEFHNRRNSSHGWLLRSPGSNGQNVAFVETDGKIIMAGGYVNSTSSGLFGSGGGGVRPVLWLELE